MFRQSLDEERGLIVDSGEHFSGSEPDEILKAHRQEAGAVDGCDVEVDGEGFERAFAGDADVIEEAAVGEPLRVDG